MVLRSILVFAAIPVLAGGVFYAFTHLQLFALHKILRIDSSAKLRKRLCIAAFFTASAASFLLVCLNEYFRLHLNNGSS